MNAEAVFRYFNDQRLIFLVTLIVAVLLAYQLSILIWSLVPEPELEFDPVPAQLAQSQQPQQALSTRQKTAQISAQHLFGRAEQAPVRAAAPVKDAPKSSLRYKLRGIYYSTDQALASVILQKDASDTQFYRLGDEVDRNIYIEQIHPDHIIIARSGRLEKLVLEKPTTDVNAPRERVAALNTQPAQSSRVLQNYRRRYKDNPMALAKRFQAIPVEENGKNVGYKLRALRGERLLQKLNLQPDDVFLEINGIGLDKPFQALDALKSLTTANSVALTIMRNGNRETLDFNLQ